MITSDVQVKVIEHLAYYKKILLEEHGVEVFRKSFLDIYERQGITISRSYCYKLVKRFKDKVLGKGKKGMKLAIASI